MENAGAVTFDEGLLLLDPDSATEQQRRDMSWVMTHELAHQWFGDLVTMTWWDDIWLNEGFASWMEARVEADLHPEFGRGLSQLEEVHRAMSVDGLTRARRIRQPIRDNDDITAAFDSITYQKGAGVLSMFERWLGAATFQRGIRQYLTAHRFGSATSADLSAALGEASGRDVATPMSTFLDHGGVPLVEARPVCAGGRGSVVLRQSRYLPVGSSGTRTQRWQIPVCVRYEAAGHILESCMLSTEAETVLELEGGACPAWVMPNADGAGYYRWSLPPADAARLVSGTVWSRLTSRERMSVAETLGADFAAATMPAADVLGRGVLIALDPERRVAGAPMPLLASIRDHVVGEANRPRAEAFARTLYGPALRRLGWQPRRGESGDTTLWRRELVEFMAFVGRDPAVRREAARRGRAYAPADGPLQPQAVSADLADTALAVAVQEGDAAFFDALRGRLPSVQDTVVRRRIVQALGHATDPALSRRAIDLALDATLHDDEATSPIWIQMGQPETREAAWRWLQEHLAALARRVGALESSWLPWFASEHCDSEHVRQARELFEPAVRSLPGAAPNLAQALEAVSLCEARVHAQREGTEAFFAGR